MGAPFVSNVPNEVTCDRTAMGPDESDEYVQIVEMSQHSLKVPHFPDEWQASLEPQLPLHFRGVSKPLYVNTDLMKRGGISPKGGGYPSV
jgi:hypothetical protein